MINGYSVTDEKSLVANWNFSIPPANIADRKLFVLTIMGIAIPGIWYGKVGEHFSAWHEITQS